MLEIQHCRAGGMVRFHDLCRGKESGGPESERVENRPNFPVPLNSADRRFDDRIVIKRYGPIFFALVAAVGGVEPDNLLAPFPLQEFELVSLFGKITVHGASARLFGHRQLLSILFFSDISHKKRNKRGGKTGE